MSNAAIYLHAEAYDTSGETLMGRHAAGESFLRGYLAHADVTEHVFWNVTNQPTQKLQSLVERIGASRHPIAWLRREDRPGLGRLGVLNLPGPNIADEAWRRAPVGPTTYGICGLTHTTATERTMDAIGSLLTAPVEPWDVLICTSRAVRASVEAQLEAVRADLEERLGASRLPQPQLATIPLGVNTEDFRTTAESKARWRAELDIPEGAIVALYVGRFHAHAKMNPLPMAIALERAAQATGRQIAWVQAGWSGDGRPEHEYHDAVRRFCPSVHYAYLDGRRPDVRFSIWSVADFFISLSDNIQETFGLTPLEAMAAGIPSVVSDWDGYRDTVRHEVDGFRIPTYAPRPGLGRDLAYRHASGWINYGAYVGAAAQMTCVDVEAAARAISTLVSRPEVRQKMGRAAQHRAVTEFDWRAVIPQYQALWAEQNARRLSARKPAVRDRRREDPNRMDPFRLFASYPTEWVTPTTYVTAVEGVNSQQALEVLSSPMAARPLPDLMPKDVAHRVLARLQPGRPIRVDQLLNELSAQPYERGLLWLAKYGLIRIHPTSDDTVEN